MGRCEDVCVSVLVCKLFGLRTEASKYRDR